jgi:bifunctional DNA-binding transcriptional regulator/antitoxin component of YhaV-PrlF toxin-antitoxin module
MSQTLLIENGKIALPDDVLDRYRLDDKTTLRIIETRNGILLVPLTDEPMSADLRDELEAWQELGAEGFGMFPYEELET